MSFSNLGGLIYSTYLGAKVNEVNEKVTRREGLDEPARMDVL
jgi:hypothetical protein